MRTRTSRPKREQEKPLVVVMTHAPEPGARAELVDLLLELLDRGEHHERRP